MIWDGPDTLFLISLLLIFYDYSSSTGDGRKKYTVYREIADKYYKKWYNPYVSSIAL